MPEELQEKGLTLHVGCLELKILTPLSLIGGLRAAVAVTYKLKVTQTHSPLLQFDYLMLVIILVW